MKSWNVAKKQKQLRRHLFFINYSKWMITASFVKKRNMKNSFYLMLRNILDDISMIIYSKHLMCFHHFTEKLLSKAKFSYDSLSIKFLIKNYFCCNALPLNDLLQNKGKNLISETIFNFLCIDIDAFQIGCWSLIL